MFKNPSIYNGHYYKNKLKIEQSLCYNLFAIDVFDDSRLALTVTVCRLITGLMLSESNFTRVLVV